MRKFHLVALALALAGTPGGAAAQTVVSANVTTNTTWGGAANPSPIILNGVIFVKNATLTILPGTLVRGQPRSSGVVAGQTAGSPGALIVTQTGRIVASASAANPIIFTTAATDNDDDGVADDADLNGFEDPWNPGDLFLDDTPTTAPLAPLNKAGKANVGLWGGLVVLGNAPTNDANRAGVGYGRTVVEGLTVPGFPAIDATYGGIEPHDNSGILRYVSIRHAGDELGEGNELNGLSLGGVGDGTVIENVEVYANFDDGVEWFGGTVNGRNLAVFFVGDDMFDLDEGYTGVNQFLFGIAPFFREGGGTPYGSASGDKAAEFDGDNYRPDNVAKNDDVNIRLDVTENVVDATPWPLSNPVMYNMTLLGSTPDPGQEFAPAFAPGTKRGIQMRNGFAGAVHNSIVLNTGAETGIEVDTGATGAPGFNAIDNANNGLIALLCSTLDDGAALAVQEQTVVNNGDALNLALGGTASGANSVNGAFNGLEKEDASFDPTGNSDGKLVASLKSSPVNPRPKAGLVGSGGCLSPRGPGLDANATYRGAFSRLAPTLWTTGWTSLSLGGLLAN
jgi:hypothetical protein